MYFCSSHSFFLRTKEFHHSTGSIKKHMGRFVAQDAQEAEVAVNNKREILSGKVEK